MKIEVRCPGCGKGYLVEESKMPADGGFVPCQSCTATIELRPTQPRAPHPLVAAATAMPPAAAGSEVCCPRCSHRFVPDAKPVQKSSGRPTLLIVEDMDYFIELARGALGSRYDLKIAKTLGEARPILARGGIDLLLLDVTLEKGENGLQLLKEPPGKVCPVLLFTAQDESDMYGDGWERLKASGVDDAVIKGMNMEEALLRKVAGMLGETIAEDAFQR